MGKGSHSRHSAGWTRRDFMKTGAGAMLAAPAMAQPQPGSQAAKGGRGISKPNILMIMDDQHRGDCLGCDGNPVIQTPNLDRLAAEGAHFRHAYSTTPTCTPARAALLTGLQPWNHGMLGYSRVGEQYPFEMPRALGEAGYYTMAIGKNHFHPQRNAHGYQHVLLDESGRVQDPEFRSDYRAWFWSVAPTRDPDATGIGWNDYRAGVYALPEDLHPTMWTGNAAVRFLEGYDRSEPFFLKVSFARPHSPYDPPKRFMDRYKGVDMPAASIGDWAGRYAPRSDDSHSIWHGDLGSEQAQESRRGYYGSVSFIDEQIGRIIETLEARGWLEETLIVFFSDHGDMLGDHHMWRKSYAYEGSARVPMIVRWPDGLASGKRGQVRDECVEIRDIFPTFLDAAGASGAERTDGMSMLSLVSGNNRNWRPFIDLEHDVCYSRKNHWSALTDGREKYIFHAVDGEEQLFDLTEDPGETTDLAGKSEQAARVRHWREQLIAHLSERGEPFVVNGELGLRPESMKHSPNYPG